MLVDNKSNLRRSARERISEDCQCSGVENYRGWCYSDSKQFDYGIIIIEIEAPHLQMSSAEHCRHLLQSRRVACSVSLALEFT